MNVKKIELSDYKDSLEFFHIHKVSGKCRAQESHYHNYFQIYYVLKGYLVHRTDYGEATLSYGNVFIIPPNFKHGISLKTPSTEFYSCSFTEEFVRKALVGQPYNQQFLDAILSSEPQNIIKNLALSIQEQIHLENILDFMNYEYKQRKNNVEEALKSGICMLFSVISDAYLKKEQLHGDDDINNPIGNSLIYIKEHYNEAITIGDVAKKVYMQRNVFCNKFKEATGMTFKEYTNKLRIEKSLELLKNESNYSLEKISLMCGYDNYITFYRNFVAFVGISPTEYIKKFK